MVSGKGAHGDIVVNSRPVKRGFITGGALVIGVLILCSAHLFAREQTTSPTFEKGDVAKKDTYSYTIKQKDTLYSLVSLMRPSGTT